MGDPCGIGPEVTAKALKKFKNNAVQLTLIGDEVVFQRYFKGIQANFLDLKILDPKNFKPGQPNPQSDRASIAYLNAAIELLKNKSISGLVTAPLSKEAVGRTGISFQGHTEYLAEAFQVKKFGMLFVTPKLKTIIVTRHIPVNEVSRTLNPQNIFETIELVDQTLREFFKIPQPIIAVCGLNPHAGEGGTIGKEEIEKILPAIRQAVSVGIEATGPFAADTLFTSHNLKKMDAVVAMYHDQGLIPVKSLFFSEVVNMTAGLPFIRTSPAHGTAYDIAGKNKADASSMFHAIELASRLSHEI